MVKGSRVRLMNLRSGCEPTTSGGRHERLERDRLRRQGQPAPGAQAGSRGAVRDGRERPLDRRDRLHRMGDQGRRRSPDRRDGELLHRLRRGPRGTRGRRAARPQSDAAAPRRGCQGVSRPGPGRSDRPPSLGLREDDGDQRGARSRGMGRAASRAQVHGAAAGLFLPMVPARRLRHARLGHPAGHRPGAWADGRYRRPARAAHVHRVAGHR